MTDPTQRTAAGRDLAMWLRWAQKRLVGVPSPDHIAAIEAEAVASWLASPEAEGALTDAIRTALWPNWSDVPDWPEAHWRKDARAILAHLRGESDG
jgi:hypothetical protein